MNQSNKALREEIEELPIRIVLKSNDLKHYLHPNSAQELFALVTNHIKGRLPEKKTGTIDLGDYDENEIDQIEQDTAIVITFRQGYNQALDEVSQILKEMGE